MAKALGPGVSERDPAEPPGDPEAPGFHGTERFEVLGRLGEGGMGVVYEALDRERGSRVALKTLRRLDGEEVRRLKREFRTLQDVQHPNLVTLGELFEEEGQWFFTMELVKGVDFISWVRPDGDAFDEARLREALADLARALGALHGAGMMHRDIKPKNVVVTSEGRVVLFDFGLAAPQNEVQPGDSSHVYGTASYMAPEQGTSRPVGPEADMYALGVILYQALTGEVPLSGDPGEVLRSKQGFEPHPPSSRNATVPRDLDELCAALLAPEPRARPAAPDILRKLSVKDDTAERPRRDSDSHFVGRRRELAELFDALSFVRPGNPVAVYIGGESGLGKSALVRRFAREAMEGQSSGVVLVGRCFEREAVPYKAFDDIVESLCDYLAWLSGEVVEGLLTPDAAHLPKVFPVLAKVSGIAARAEAAPHILDPRELRARVFTALRELLARLSRRSRLILTIDDLQWADHDSLALLDEILRPPDAPGILLVGTYSHAEGELARLVSRGNKIELKPLAADEAQELATRLIERTGSSTSVSPQVMAMEGGGHPLFVDELIRHALAHKGSGAPPAKLDEALWSRIERLEPEMRRVLELVCVSGAPVSQAAVARATGVSPDEFTKHLSFLRGAHLVRTAGWHTAGPVEPSHDRIRQAVLANLDHEQTMRHHERLARALEESGEAHHDVLAIHWMSSGEKEKASTYAFLAAEQATEALAFERAAQLYLQAMHLDPDSSARLWELQRKLGEALVNCGHSAEAAATFAAASELAEGEDALDLRRRAAVHYLFSGHIEEGLAAARAVLEEIGLEFPEGRGRILLRLGWVRARLRLRGFEFEERPESEIPAEELRILDVLWSIGMALATVDTMLALYFQTLHLLRALRVGEPYRVARGVSGEASFVAAGGTRSRKRAARLTDLADSLAEASGHPHASGVAIGAGVLSAVLQARFRACLELSARCERIFREQCLGATWEIDTAHIFNIISLEYLGDLAEMVRRHRVYLRGARERGDLYLEISLLTGHGNLCWLVEGDVEGARRAQRDAMELWTSEGFHLQHFWDLLAKVQTDLYVGDGEAAWGRVRERWRGLERSLLLRIQLVRVEAVQLRARAALAAAREKRGEVSSLLRVAERGAKRLEKEGTLQSIPMAHLVRAGVYAVRGHVDRALAELGAAEEAFEAGELELYAAASRRRRGELLRGEEGRALIDAADAQMRAEGIAEPERFAAMLAPGFP